MAEPLILAYGRGELPEFPAAADTIVDIVPVDHVVAAIVAVLAAPAGGRRRRRTSTSSPGDRNPLTFRRLYAAVRGLLRRAPLRRRRPRRGAAAGVALPGRAARRAAAGHQRASAQGGRLRRSATRRAATGPATSPASLDRQGRRLEFLRRYLDLYREYAQAELRFDDAHTRRAPRRPAPRADRDASPSTPPSIDWDALPRRGPLPGGHGADPRGSTSVRAARAKPAGRPTARSSRSTPSEPAASAAFFDMDGTLLSSNVIETYLWMRLQELSGAERLGRARADRRPGARSGAARSARERSAFLRSIYRRVRRRPARRPRRVVDDRADRPRAVAARARPPYAGSASTGPPATRPSSSPARSGR